MILDALKHAGVYRGLGTRIDHALEYLAKTDFSKLAPGRYEIDGNRIYALVQHYETKPRDKGVWEAHRRYIDVQFVAEGVEAMGWASVEGLKVTTPYASEHDCELFSGTGDLVTVRAGAFAIFFPRDAHMPCLAYDAPAPVRKVVVKVAVE